MIKQRLEVFAVTYTSLWLQWLTCHLVHGFYMPAGQTSMQPWGILVLGVIYFLILFYENTIYTIPIILSLLFTIGLQYQYLINWNIYFRIYCWFNYCWLYYPSHQIQVKPKLNALGLSLIAAAISFMVQFINHILRPSYYSQVWDFYLFIFLFTVIQLKKSDELSL